MSCTLINQWANVSWPPTLCQVVMIIAHHAGLLYARHHTGARMITVSNPYKEGINIVPILWMRMLNFQELRQFVHSHTAHLAPAVVGATGNKDVFGRIFADMHGVFTTQPQKSHTVISAILCGPKQSPTSAHVQREETSTSPPRGRSIGVTLSQSMIFWPPCLENAGCRPIPWEKQSIEG